MEMEMSFGGSKHLLPFKMSSSNLWLSLDQSGNISENVFILENTFDTWKLVCLTEFNLNSVIVSSFPFSIDVFTFT